MNQDLKEVREGARRVSGGRRVSGRGKMQYQTSRKGPRGAATGVEWARRQGFGDEVREVRVGSCGVFQAILSSWLLL